MRSTPVRFDLLGMRRRLMLAAQALTMAVVMVLTVASFGGDAAAA
jgi:hypothetical protein